MRSGSARAVKEIQVSDKGDIRVPARFRKAHKLAKGSRVLAIEVGDGLMLVPREAALDVLSHRVQAALATQGVTVADALKNLPRVRKKLFAELYGKR